MDRTVLLPVLVDCYRRIGVAADQMPYTAEFELLYATVLNRTGLHLSKAEVWRLLANARKCGHLPRLIR